mgnify:CR=1 FL=1
MIDDLAIFASGFVACLAICTLNVRLWSAKLVETRKLYAEAVRTRIRCENLHTATSAKLKRVIAAQNSLSNAIAEAKRITERAKR